MFKSKLLKEKILNAMEMKVERGTHAIIDLFGCNEILLDDILTIKQIFKKAIKESGLVMVKNGEKFHKFNPHGLTGIVLLQSSHISIHTWPEKNYATMDIFACDKKQKVSKFVEVFLKEMKPKKYKQIILRRGYVTNNQKEKKD